MEKAMRDRAIAVALSLEDDFAKYIVKRISERVSEPWCIEKAKRTPLYNAIH